MSSHSSNRRRRGRHFGPNPGPASDLAPGLGESGRREPGPSAGRVQQEGVRSRENAPREGALREGAPRGEFQPRAQGQPALRPPQPDARRQPGAPGGSPQGSREGSRREGGPRPDGSSRPDAGSRQGQVGPGRGRDGQPFREPGRREGPRPERPDRPPRQELPQGSGTSQARPPAQPQAQSQSQLQSPAKAASPSPRPPQGSSQGVVTQADADLRKDTGRNGSRPMQRDAERDGSRVVQQEPARDSSRNWERRVKPVVTLEDLCKENDRIEKEILLEIAEIHNLKLDF
mgnify:CR=1 FL=1